MKVTEKDIIIERDRRMYLLDGLIKKNELDALLFTSTSQQAYQMAVKYTTGYPLTTRRDFAFKTPGKMPYLIVPTVGQQFHARKISWLSEENVLSGSMQDFIPEFVRAIGKSKPRIGLYEPDEIPAKLNSEIMALGAELVDITEQFTEARAAKSDFEVMCLRDASRVAVASFEHVVRNLMPGKTEREIVGAAEGFLRANGAEDTLVLVRSEKPHTFIARPTDTKIRDDGVFVYSVEMAGAFGYWTQCVRPVFMKRGAQPEAYDVLQVIKKAEAAGAEAFVPGNRICDVAEAVEKVVAENSCKTGVWSGHGMGADLGDGVAIGTDNKMKIVPNMVLTLHPSVMSDTDGLLFGNTWLSTENKAVCLTPQYAEECYIDELRQLIK